MPSDPQPSSTADRSVPSREVSRGRLGRLARKELKETLRDRRTIITLVLMPVLVYPLLSLLFQRFLITQSAPGQIPALRLGARSRDQAEALSSLISLGEGRFTESFSTGHSSPTEAPTTHAVEYSYTDDLESAVASLDVDLGVRLLGSTSDFRRGVGPDFEIQLLQLNGSRNAIEAARFVESRLLAARLRILEERLDPQATKTPGDFRVSTLGVSPADGTTAFSLASLVPLILILMTITGAVYPAIDLTAGERERGTLEALIAAPVPRLGLLSAKYVAVVTVAMLTAAVNLIAMAVTIQVAGLGPTLFGKAGVSILLVAQVFGLLALFAAFFSAVLLAITSFARSFKEAQAYLIPVMMLSMAPGMSSLLPGIKLTGAYAVTPLLNIVLLSRDLCERQIVPLPIALAVVVSTALYAAAALSIAARIFGSDAILYGSQSNWSDLLRRPEKSADSPTIASAFFVLAVLFPVYFLASQLLGRSEGMEIAERLAASAGLTMALFVGFPVVACRVRAVSLRTGLRLHAFPPLSIVGATLLGLSLWVLDFELVILAGEVGNGSLNELVRSRVAEMVKQWRTLPVMAVLAAMALTPAFCEELFFRGFLLSGLRTRLGRGPAIATSGVLFGAFHLVTSGALSLIRFLPSSLMGIVLGWVCLRTGSLFPGVVLHAVHNGLLILLAYYSPEIQSRGWDVEGTTHLPGIWIVAAGAAAMTGALLVAVATRSTKNEQDAPP